MTSRTIFLTTRAARQRAHALIDAAPEGWVMRLGEATRTDEQNKALWPRIRDIQQQVPEMATFSANDVKMRFLNALGAEMRFLPELEGAGMFPVGLSSKALTVEQFSALLELINEWAARNGVTWSNEKEDLCPAHVTPR